MASRLGETSEVHFVVEGADGIRVRDNLQATQLFHIAQEACTNAIKHGRAKNIQVQLRHVDHAVVLRIVDDGIGIPEAPPKGLGLRIMHDRASVIGAKLTIEAAKPRGTVVTCTLKELGYAPES
jgi:signal transduction histidine kinase